MHKGYMVLIIGAQISNSCVNVLAHDFMATVNKWKKTHALNMVGLLMKIKTRGVNTKFHS